MHLQAWTGLFFLDLLRCRDLMNYPQGDSNKIL